MAKKPATTDDLAYLLQYLVAIELFRAGVSQDEIRKRLRINANTVSEMLKGLSQHLETQTDAGE
jgi:DNA-binding IclR family transcriptional regulator